MNASPPSGSPAACVRGAGRRGPRPIALCAGIAAKSGARPSAQDARRPRRLAYNTAAETRNDAARLRATGAGGAIGHGRTRARARAAADIHPLKAARCANRATWHGVTGSGNNMPRGVPPVCAAGAVRRRPVMPPAATGAPGAPPNAQEKKRRMQKPPALRPAASTRALYRLCRTIPGRVRCPRAPAGPGRVRASIAVCRFCHLEFTVIEIATGEGVNHGTWDRWEDIVICLAFAKLSRDTGGADPGYVEHRLVSGAGVRKLVAARYARFRGFAPLRLARPTPAGTVPGRHIGEMRRDGSRASRRLHIGVPGNMDPA